MTEFLLNDEATFLLNGLVNLKNCRYWTYSEAKIQNPVNVWVGNIGEELIGPFSSINLVTKI